MRNAIVTGGSGGIGRECGRALVERGYDVVLCARNAQRLQAAAADIGARYVVADASDPESFAAVTAAVEQVDLVVHAAGVLGGTYARKQSFDQWRATMTANLDSCFVVTHAVLPAMVPGSRFVFLSSSAAHEPMPGRTAYSASKAGMNAFARALALEVDRDGIAVHIVTPGPVETEMLQDVPFEMHAIRALDVAEAVAWLDTVDPAVDLPEIRLSAVTRGPWAKPPVVPEEARRRTSVDPAPPAPEGVPFGDQVALRAAADPDGVGVVVVHVDGRETVLTWRDLELSANRWARMFTDRGVDVGATVALAVPNSPELVLAALACWKIGAVPVPMRWDLPEWERGRLLEVIAPALVLDEADVDDLRRAAQTFSPDPVETAVSPAMNGICSSGSTGLPKVILNTNPALWTPLSSEPFMSQWRHVDQPQTILVPAPMYHTNGFNPLFYLLGGDRLVLLEKFSGPAMLDAIERHRITNFTATPTMLSRVADVDDIESRDLSSIDWILQGAAVMPATLLRRWFDLLSPEKVLMAYGMTENLGLTSLRGDEWLRHPGSVGRGFRDTEIRIADAAGEPLPAGEIGEIYLKAPMTGSYRYLGGAPPLPTTPDGFTSAGDLGHLDEDGYLFIADRRSDMIITGGANVFPAEVESALLDHDDIVDVVVIGLADAKWGRRVHAVVQPRDDRRPPSPDDVIAYAKTRLAGYKVPKTVEFVAEIPRTAATKVNRSAMVKARENG